MAGEWALAAVHDIVAAAVTRWLVTPDACTPMTATGKVDSRRRELLEQEAT